MKFKASKSLLLVEAENDKELFRIKKVQGGGIDLNTNNIQVRLSRQQKEKVVNFLEGHLP